MPDKTKVMEYKGGPLGFDIQAPEWAVEAIATLGEHYGTGPKTERAVIFAAAAFARIVQNQPAAHWIEFWNQNKSLEEKWTAERWAEKFGQSSGDLEWIMRAVMDQIIDRFPLPMQIRRIYYEQFTPADGKNPGDFKEVKDA